MQNAFADSSVLPVPPAFTACSTGGGSTHGLVHHLKNDTLQAPPGQGIAELCAADAAVVKFAEKPGATEEGQNPEIISFVKPNLTVTFVDDFELRSVSERLHLVGLACFLLVPSFSVFVS